MPPSWLWKIINIWWFPYDTNKFQNFGYILHMKFKFWKKKSTFLFTVIIIILVACMLKMNNLMLFALSFIKTISYSQWSNHNIFFPQFIIIMRALHMIYSINVIIFRTFLVDTFNFLFFCFIRQIISDYQVRLFSTRT